MDPSMTKEKSDSLMRDELITITLNTDGAANFVRKLNKAKTQFEQQRVGGFDMLAKQRTESYGQN